MNEKTFIDKIYDVQTSAAMRDTYDQWADSYEAELTQHHYRTPTRVAQALTRHLTDPSLPILDFACGTGLSGQALHEHGFTCIDGIDLSEGMIAKARKKNVYRDLIVCQAESPFGAAVGPYSAITAVGAIGAGAAPVECLSAAIDYLATNALLCVSLNDHTLEDASYEQVLQSAVKAGTIHILEDEYGEHIPNIGLKAKIFVVQKL